MPLFTPSRLAVVAITLSLVSFLWTFGLPHPLAPPLPILEHPDEIKHDSVILTPSPTAVVLPTTVLTPTPKTVPTPTDRWDTPLPGGSAHNEDGGRWNDSVTASATPTTPTTPTPTPSTPVLGHCKDVRNAPHVMVIVKTSKAEIHKLSAHVRGLLSCVPNFAIFSDHAGEIDGIPVYDVLHDITAETKQKHEEFREYRIIKADDEYKPDVKKTKDLDKWKILPMVYQAYRMNPHAKFYAFIEADTGLSWTNLLQWVDRLDYRIPYYSGAQSFLNRVQFAQRGSGILLSQGALRRYAKSYDERYDNEWEARVGKECCGDMVLATALSDAHVELYTAWPLIQGEQPNTLDYTPKQWCTPAVSWHHMDKAALGTSWDLQKKWTDVHGWEKPYLYKNAFEEYVQPYLVAQKEGWDNMGSDTKIVAPQGRQKQLLDEQRAFEEKTEAHRRDGIEVDIKIDDKEQKEEKKEKADKTEDQKNEQDDKKDDKKEQEKDDKKDDKKEPVDWTKIGTMVQDGADNAEACKTVCTEVDDCLQWRYTTEGDGECHLSKAIRLGRATESRDGAQQWTSGWMVDRIKTVTDGWTCKEANWKFYQ